MYDVGCKKSDRIWEAERMKNYKRSGAAGFLCAAALFLGTGVLALGTSAFNALAAEVSGQITSCKITDDKQNVEIALNSSGSTEGTDGKVYVFEQPTYQDDLGSRSDYLTSANASGATTVTVPFNKGDGSDCLYSKFVLAVKEDGTYKAVSEPHYITNPAILVVTYFTPRSKASSNMFSSMFKPFFVKGSLKASVFFATISGLVI